MIKSGNKISDDLSEKLSMLFCSDWPLMMKTVDCENSLICIVHIYYSLF